MNHTARKIKYIFRDFGGVIASFEKGRFSGQIAKIYKISLQEAKDIFFRYRDDFRNGKISEDMLRKKISHDIHKPIPLHEQKDIVFPKSIRKFFSLKISVVRFIRRLQESGYITIMMSDQFPPTWDAMKRAGRDTILDANVVSCDLGFSKYDDAQNGTKKFFDYALKKYKIQLSEVIFIDDTEHNCEVARKMGIKTILAKNARQIIKDVKKLLHV